MGVKNKEKNIYTIGVMHLQTVVDLKIVICPRGHSKNTFVMHEGRGGRVLKKQAKMNRGWFKPICMFAL